MKRKSLLLILFLSIFTVLGIAYAIYNTSSNNLNVFKTDKYNIIIDTQGGTISDTSLEVKNNSVIMPSISRRGYTFLGYTTIKNGTVDIKGVEEIKKINNKTIYAKWKANTFIDTVSCEAWGLKNKEGNNKSKNAFYFGEKKYNVDYDSSFTLDLSKGCSIPKGFKLPNGEKAEGDSRLKYNFHTESYPISPDKNWVYKTFPYTFVQSDNDIYVEYNYIPITYTVTYNLNGGTNNSANPQTYNILYGFSLTNPTRVGYTFAGWTDASGKKVTGINENAKNNFTTTEDFNSNLNQRTIGNQTLTANWKATEYKLSYNLNGGTVNPANKKSYNVETASFTLTNPTRVGYTFAGWTGTGLSKATTTVTIPAGSTGKRSYTANWIPNSVTVSFNGNCGTITKNGTQTFTSGNGQRFADTGAFRNGYTLLGWSDSPTAIQQSYTILSGVTDSWIGNGGTRTIYATWKINSYNLTVNPNGGKWNNTTNSSKFSMKFNDTKAISNPTRDNSSAGSYAVTFNGNGVSNPATINAARTNSYTFKNWTVAGTGSTLTNTTFKMGYADATLTANWNQTTTTSAITLPTVTRDNYTFLGWYDAATGGNKIGDAGAKYTPNKAITLYAEWVLDAVEYKVYHQQEQNDASYKTVDTETFMALPNTKVTPKVKSYTDYESPSTQTITVSEKGNSKVTYKYTRKKRIVTFDPATNGTIKDNEKQRTVLKGNKLGTLPVPSTGDYTFDGWYENMFDADDFAKNLSLPKESENVLKVSSSNETLSFNYDFTQSNFCDDFQNEGIGTSTTVDLLYMNFYPEKYILDSSYGYIIPVDSSKPLSIYSTNTFYDDNLYFGYTIIEWDASKHPLVSLSDVIHSLKPDLKSLDSFKLRKNTKYVTLFFTLAYPNQNQIDSSEVCSKYYAGKKFNISTKFLIKQGTLSNNWVSYHKKANTNDIINSDTNYYARYTLKPGVKEGVYAKLYDTDSDGTGDKLVLNNTPTFTSTGTLIKDYDNKDNVTENEVSGQNPMWRSDMQNVTSLEIKNIIKPLNMKAYFARYFGTSLDLSNIDSSKVTDMSGMFAGASSLTSLDVSHFDTGKVTNMASMFNGSSKITSIKGLEKFNTSNVTNMTSMFAGASSLTSLDVSSFDTSKVTNMSGMFAGASSLTSLDVSHFDTHKVTNMSGMFREASSLTTIYASDKFVTTNILNSEDMFQEDEKLVGGAGTAFSNDHTDKEYARIDEGTSKPGYFTRK